MLNEDNLKELGFEREYEKNPHYMIYRFEDHGVIEVYLESQDAGIWSGMGDLHDYGFYLKSPTLEKLKQIINLFSQP